MPELDTTFRWPLYDKGYEVRELKGELRIVGRGGPLRWHQPVQFHPTLYLDFAELVRTEKPPPGTKVVTKLPRGTLEYLGRVVVDPEACAEFASKFGYLGFAVLHKARKIGEDKALRHGEAHIDWAHAASSVKSLIDFWRESLWHKINPESPTGIKFSQLEAVLVASPPDGRPRLHLRPPTLFDAIKIQLAQAISTDAAIKECRLCGKWFEAGRGRTRGRRDAEFCSQQHKIDYHNLQKKKG